MASLSTCHLGLWLGWQILLNLVKVVQDGPERSTPKTISSLGVCRQRIYILTLFYPSACTGGCRGEMKLTIFRKPECLERGMSYIFSVSLTPAIKHFFVSLSLGLTYNFEKLKFKVRKSRKLLNKSLKMQMTAEPRDELQW